MDIHAYRKLLFFFLLYQSIKIYFLQFLTIFCKWNPFEGGWVLHLSQVWCSYEHIHNLLNKYLILNTRLNHTLSVYIAQQNRYQVHKLFALKRVLHSNSLKIKIKFKWNKNKNTMYFVNNNNNNSIVINHKNIKYWVKFHLKLVVYTRQ